MKFTLLTHAKEFEKRSNTGRLVLEVLGQDAEQVAWERLRPPEMLLQQIATGTVALVYPGQADTPPDDLAGVRQCVLLDGTWLTARRMHQRSPYLRDLRRVHLRPQAPSRYNLRPHQKPGGLCTAECVIAILRQLGQDEQAETLQQRFLAFLKPSNALRMPVPRSASSA